LWDLYTSATRKWTSGPAPQKAAAFAAAEVARWIEIGMNSLSYFLAGLTLFLFGLAIALGRVFGGL
jgi:hypothetical protein